MIIASHYVLRHILRSLESGNLINAQETFKKFHLRYSTDDRLQDIYNEFLGHVVNQESEESRESQDKSLEEIKTGIKELIDIRKLGGSHGGGRLWFSDRRPGKGSVNLR